MENVHGFASEQSQLLGVVHGVRNRWRAKRALRGAAITLGAGFVVLLASSYAMHLLKYSDAAVLGARIGAALAIIALAVRFIVLPLMPRFRDDQVALYLEEHEPSLDAAVVTAVEVQRGLPSDKAMPRSPAFIERLTHAALASVHRIGDGRRVDAGELRTNGGIFAAVAALALVATFIGPSALRHSLRLLLTPWDKSAPASLFSIAVEPGNVTIARGGDQMIAARLRGFEAERVELLVRSADSASWKRLAMAPDSVGRYAFRLFDIGTKTQYAVESNGVRSSTYTIDVANLPFVKRLDLEYRF